MADGQRLAESQDITFMETSAKSNVNISEAFSTMARIILEKVRSGAEKRGREERSFLCSSGIVVHLFSVAMSYWCMYVCVFMCVCVCVCVCVRVCMVERLVGVSSVVCRTQRCSKGPTFDRRPMTRAGRPAQRRIRQSAAPRRRQPF